MDKILAIISAIRWIWETAVSIYEWVTAYFRKAEQEKEIEKAEEAVEQNERANQIQDDEQRLKEKADAACKLEKAINPKSDC